MVVIKWSDSIKGPTVKVYSPHCGGLYKEDHGYIIPWSVTDPDEKMNCFSWSIEENNWTLLGDQYNEDFNNWKGPINNGRFRQKNIKEMRKTEKHALSMQALSSLMGLIGNKIHKYPSSPTSINT